MGAVAGRVGRGALSLAFACQEGGDRPFAPGDAAGGRPAGAVGGPIQPEAQARDRAGKACLLDELARDHSLRLVLVAAKPRPTDPRQWRSSALAEDEAEVDGTMSTADWRKATDLAAAIQQVQREIPADQFAGVLVVSDGRHNHGSPVEPVARELGLHGVPIASIVIGSAAPRRDAALADVRARRRRSSSATKSI